MTGCTFTGSATIAKSMTLIGGTLTGGRLFVTASDVTVRGITVRNGTAPAQAGNIHVAGASRVRIESVTVTDSGGACISFNRTIDSGAYGSEFARCAQEGFHATGNTRFTFSGNYVHHNNPTWAYVAGWEAGGGKVTDSVGVTFTDNESAYNNGPGLWCDIHCDGATYRGNRVHHNYGEGIFYEASRNALIEANVVWENGNDDKAGWGYGAGILVSSSPDVIVRGNVVAWNWRGISVISQNHGSQSTADRSGIRVENNDIVMRTGAGLAGFYADNTSNLFTSTSGGSGNRYWAAVAEPSSDGIGRFEWQGHRNTLAAYNSTPGEEGGRYMTTTERDAVLAAAGL